jgi:hypothetical protein
MASVECGYAAPFLGDLPESEIGAGSDGKIVGVGNADGGTAASRRQMSSTQRAEARAWFEQLCWLRDLYRLRGEQDSTSCCSIEAALESIEQALTQGSGRGSAPEQQISWRALAN